MALALGLLSTMAPAAAKANTISISVATNPTVGYSHRLGWLLDDLIGIHWSDRSALAALTATELRLRRLLHVLTALTHGPMYTLSESRARYLQG